MRNLLLAGICGTVLTLVGSGSAAKADGPYRGHGGYNHHDNHNHYHNNYRGGSGVYFNAYPYPAPYAYRPAYVAPAPSCYTPYASPYRSNVYYNSPGFSFGYWR